MRAEPADRIVSIDSGPKEAPPATTTTTPAKTTATTTTPAATAVTSNFAASPAQPIRSHQLAPLAQHKRSASYGSGFVGGSISADDGGGDGDVITVITSIALPTLGGTPTKKAKADDNNHQKGQPTTTTTKKQKKNKKTSKNKVNGIGNAQEKHNSDDADEDDQNAANDSSNTLTTPTATPSGENHRTPAQRRTAAARLVQFLKGGQQRRREQQENGKERDTNGDQEQQKSPKTITTIEHNKRQQRSVASPLGGATSTTTPTAAAHNNDDVTTSPSQICQFSQCVSFQDNIADVHHRKGRRLNGLQLPLHPLQLFGWLVLLLFGLAAFHLLIPAFAGPLQGPLYGLTVGLYIVHLVSHLAALLLDPADRELRRVHRNDRIVPEFDRSKHAHVIENGRCHLCNIRTTSQRTKHCSVCNKCVGKFDHHCKWLNHCVGSRNYVAFLMCVVSAVIATLVIVAAVLAQIVFYYAQPGWLSAGWYDRAAQEAATTAAGRGLGGASVAAVLEATQTILDGSGAGELIFDGPNNITLSDGNATTIGSTSMAFYDEEPLLLLDNLTGAAVEALNDSLTQNLTWTGSDAPKNDSDLAVTASSSNGNASLVATVAAAATGIGLGDTIFLVLIGCLGLLAAITAGLLLHLCFFHIYISFLGLTTYEYIRQHRQAQEAKAKAAGMLQRHSMGGGAEVEAIAQGGGGTNNTAQSSPTTAKKKKSTPANCGQMYFCSHLRHPNAIDPHSADRRRSANEGGLGHATSMDDDGGGGGSPGRCGLGLPRLHCCANSREYHRTALKTFYMCSLLEESDGGGGGGVGVMTPARRHRIGHLDGPLGDAEAARYGGQQGDDDADGDYRTFHCCSSFAAIATQRKASAITSKATLVSDLEAALGARRSFLQYTEECSLCTLRIRSPMPQMRYQQAGGGGGAMTLPRGVGPAPLAGATNKVLANMSTTTAAQSTPPPSGGAAETHQRCCMKAISKHQRWRRKWNCCANVPDSPDVPNNDIIATLTLRHHQHGLAAAAGAGGNSLEGGSKPQTTTNATEIPVQFIRAINGGADDGGGGGGGDGDDGSPRHAPIHVVGGGDGDAAVAAAKLKSLARTRNARTWPVGRFRHMMRMFHRYRRPRCRHHAGGGGGGNGATASSSPSTASGGGGGVGGGEQVRGNQVRPLQLRGGARSAANGNGCGHYQRQQQQQQQYHHHLQQQQQHHYHGYGHPYYDSSSPPPPSSTTPSGSEGGGPTSSSSSALTTPSGLVETILPTSVIRDDSSITYTTPITLNLPPALPPPTRRKIPNPSDLEQLAETLALAAAAAGFHQGGGNLTLPPGGVGVGGGGQQRLPNVYRRPRRKHFLRTRSPTLSPIHESGLSNPTSPQPGRHQGGGNNGGGAGGSTATLNSLARGGGGGGEGTTTSVAATRKSASNLSLNSISSNSSST